MVSVNDIFVYYFIEKREKPIINYIKENCKKNLVGVEIGTAQGNNALNMLKKLPIKKLYLVDPYIPYVENGKLINAESFEKTKERLSKFKEKIKFILKNSIEASKEIPNGLDFVYIDGNHQYDFVKKDIEMYFAKLKKGGILSGHDFCIRYIDVPTAVVEFVLKNKLILSGKKTDWWLIKNENKI